MASNDDSVAISSETSRLLAPSHEYQPYQSGGSTSEQSKSEEELNHLTDKSLSEANDTSIYKRRWYILGVFALVAFVQGAVWNTWGPIAASTKVAFNWDKLDIALLNLWGCLTYVLTVPFFSWLMDVKGMRWATLVTAGLVAVGSGLRCITSQAPLATWLIHTGQILNGIGGPVAMGGGPVISATWFPANQWNGATAFCCIMNGMGVGASFVIGPLLVPQIYNHSNKSEVHNSSFKDYITDEAVYLNGNSSSSNTTDISTIRNNIKRLLYIEFAVCAALFVLILIYFPTRPPKSPSISASIQRIDIIAGAKKLFRHVKFWQLAIPYAVSMGVYNCWSSVLDINLDPVGVSQNTAGWLGFYSILAAQVTGLSFAIFADIYSRHMKLLLVLLYSGGAIALAAFTFTCADIIPLNIVVLYITLVTGVAMVAGATPLIFEMVCQSTYPIAEGLTNGLLTWLNNLIGLIFLLIVMFHVDTSWMNWCLLGSVAVCIPAFLFYKERYGRLDIETIQVPSTSDTINT